MRQFCDLPVLPGINHAPGKVCLAAAAWRGVAGEGTADAVDLKVGAVLAVPPWPERDRIETAAWSGPASGLALTRALSLKLLNAVVAAADYLFQFWQWYERRK